MLVNLALNPLIGLREILVAIICVRPRRRRLRLLVVNLRGRVQRIILVHLT